MICPLWSNIEQLPLCSVTDYQTCPQELTGSLELFWSNAHNTTDIRKNNFAKKVEVQFLCAAEHAVSVLLYTSFNGCLLWFWINATAQASNKLMHSPKQITSISNLIFNMQ